MILFFGLLGSGIVALIRYFNLITVSYWWCVVPVAISLFVIILRQMLRHGYSGANNYDDGGSMYSDIAFWSVISSGDWDSGGSSWGGGDFGDGGGGGGD